MPRLRNTTTDAVLSCDEETAARLGSEWVPADKAEPATKAPAKKAASSSKTEK